MAKILKVVDTVNWVQYPKAKWVASEFKIPYQKFTEKLGGSKPNDTQFVYGTLENINDKRIFESKSGDKFQFIYKFFERNKMLIFYIVNLNGALVKITKENGDHYLNQTIEI